MTTFKKLFFINLDSGIQKQKMPGDASFTLYIRQTILLSELTGMSTRSHKICGPSEVVKINIRSYLASCTPQGITHRHCSRLHLRTSVRIFVELEANWPYHNNSAFLELFFRFVLYTTSYQCDNHSSILYASICNSKINGSYISKLYPFTLFPIQSEFFFLNGIHNF